MHYNSHEACSCFVCEKRTVPFRVAKSIYEKGFPPWSLSYMCHSQFSGLTSHSFPFLNSYHSRPSPDRRRHRVFSCCSSPSLLLPASCQPRAYTDKSEHRILNFSTTMSAPNQPMQPAYIQKSGHSHGNKWNHGLFDCCSPCDTCKLPAPALPFIPTITCGKHL
jgi:hypothetical protein